MFSKWLITRIAGCTAACLFFFTANAQNKTPGSLAYSADSVEFTGKQTGLLYGATITVPKQPGRHTAVILVSGTGAQDRDGTMAGHKMFKEIADELSGKGIVVLRIDDRGVGRSTGDYAQSTTGDFANDVLEAFAYLQTRKEVNKNKIGLLGHSEGGASISIAASREPRVAFLISLAGLCVNGYDALILQNEALVSAAALTDLDKKRYNDINTLMFKTVREYADSADLEKVLNQRYEDWKKQDDELVKAKGIQYDHFRFPIYSYSKQAAGQWYRYFVKYDPAVVLAKVTVPILALNGDKDIIMSYKENLENWKKLPAKGLNKDVTTVLIPGVDHLFLPCNTCTTQEAKTNTQPMSAIALQTISEWVKKRF
ncbi:alpha/beta hydrolase family protein [Mucilaginibacter auburnensis]|uniref:Serine aminopeptidase S33 domain-containing protein n=1 Tax=Mucilaginibacter auburnensis TaxID=1457233 RepID=A0A2H9VWA8_9SPHI|nr:alpha/beta hydrolase [Mucilaginibacter auburnensis]PJJ85079.1 hypothetical protein CLV57_2107 [Mucilaginibacter auburnensis]